MALMRDGSIVVKFLQSWNEPGWGLLMPYSKEGSGFQAGIIRAAS